jgi:hypothetical protein
MRKLMKAWTVRTKIGKTKDNDSPDLMTPAPPVELPAPCRRTGSWERPSSATRPRFWAVMLHNRGNPTAMLWGLSFVMEDATS